MNTSLFLFYLFGSIILAPAILILFTRNIIHSVYLLVFSFLGIAGLYVLAHAEFVAVTQILVYTGGILILLIFGIMLTNRYAGEKVLTGSSNLLMGIVLGLLVFFILIKGFGLVRFPAPAVNTEITVNSGLATQQIGIRLMTRYVLAFEAAGILLLIALVGASFHAWKKTDKENDSR